MAVNSRLVGAAATPPLALAAVDAATVFTQQAATIRLLRRFEPIGPYRQIRHAVFSRPMRSIIASRCGPINEGLTVERGRL